VGSAYAPAANISRPQATIIRRAISDGVLSGTHWALLFAAGVLLLGALVSFLIPSALQSEKETPLEALPDTIDPLAVDAAIAGAD
jgi:hypothetical protein